MKNGKIYLILISLTIFVNFFTGGLSAQTNPVTGEEELFNSSNDPDALLLFDLSGSMNEDPTGVWNESGGNFYPRYGNTSCSGTTFYNDTTHGTTYQTDCRKVAIAKRVVQSVLDDNGDTIINSSDASSQGVRFGYMRFRNCSSNSEESTKAYGSTAACAADLVNCSGSTCGRTDGFCNNAIPAGTRYSSSAACTADTQNCSGAGCTDGLCTSPIPIGTVTHWASSSCGTPDTINCAGTGCNGGFCNNSIAARPDYHASSSCGTQDTTNCTGTGCSGGFCDIDHAKPARIYYARRYCSTASTRNCPDSIPGCSGGFCNSPQPTCNVYCSSPGCAIDCPSPGCTVPCATATGCTVACTTIGCEQNCAGAHTESWNSGCNTLIAPIAQLYSCIYCSDQISCPYTANTACTNTASVSTETATGGTHLAAALNEAKMYLSAHQALDPSRACRKKFVILLTDGADTYACGGNGQETQADQYKRRRESVAYAKQLADAGYKVFVIGFGKDMAAQDKNTLNWMAYYGGTDNPNLANSGSVTGSNAYVIPTGRLYPSGITSCCDGGSDANCVATANDPGDSVLYPLNGYAFFAEDSSSLTAALKSAISIIRESTYSFTQASVQSSRTADENYIYEASFEPVSSEPFWHGHLKKFQINSDGSVGAMVTNGDAGANLESKTAADRIIKTYVNGSLINFTTSAGIDHKYFGYDTGNHTADMAASSAVIGYIRGDCSGTPCYNPDSGSTGVYKLGDVFRSTPITVGTPSLFYADNRDQYSWPLCVTQKTQSAFADFRGNHCRASSCSSSSDREKRLVTVGANDGQLHAFKTNDVSEAWSFIPPNLLSKLKSITHSTNPTTQSHEYYVDGQVTVADAWLGTGDGTCKTEADWKTLLVFGEGRGSNPNTWSASQYCDYNFSTNSKYSTTYPYYCGYYALNITDTTNPTFLWHITGSGTNGAIDSSLGPYLGDAWSKINTGRVRYKNASAQVVEKWVGFVGGGYNGSDCAGATSGTNCTTNCDCRGKGFFVIDLSNGQILWSFTLGSSETATTSAYMKYSIPSDAAIADMDNDGFIDTAYIGDLGGNMWRFKFCKTVDGTSCAISNWSGMRLFDGTTSITPVRPVYVAPTVTRDNLNNLWVYWGTGDKNDPMKIPGTPSYPERFFALKDTNPASAYSLGDLRDITSSTYCNEIRTGCTASDTKNGYYIRLASGEKMLSESLVFGGVVYFTTYTPPGSTSTDCTQNGTASLYGINYTTGSGALSGGDRSVIIGTGIPSSPVVSERPGGSGIFDIYVTVSGGFTSGGGGCTGNTCQAPVPPPGMSNMTNVLYWKDRRLE